MSNPGKGLRANALAALVMLLLEIGFGVGVSLSAPLPIRDAGKSLFPAFAQAVAQGPLVLTIHALLGTLLIISGIVALVRAIKIHQARSSVLAGLGLLAILVAWVSGAKFVGSQNDGASLSMTIAAVVAVFSYALILFLKPPTNEPME